MKTLRALLMVILLAGVPSVALAKVGFFRVEQCNGVWWFIDPEGRPMISLGVDDIRYCPDRIRGAGPCPYMDSVKKLFPTRQAWEEATLARLREWGFNTIGAWSDPELWDRGVGYTVILNIAAHAGADWQHGRPVDVFDPRFDRMADEVAQKECASRKDDRLLLGYFSDNELRWGADWRGKETMLQMILELPAQAPGRRAAIEFLRKRYGGDIERLNRAWQVKTESFEQVPARPESEPYRADADTFLEKFAARYFEVCARAIRAADPNHLYLGARFAGRPPEPVLRASGPSDVVSINVYSTDPRPTIEYVFKTTGKPILVTEFAFRATNSGLPNTKGAGPKVADQQARAKAYAEYVTKLESLPEVVGYHWFKWTDEPKEGRFDGENSNYGLVDIEDRPYREFVEAVKAANTQAAEIHSKR